MPELVGRDEAATRLARAQSSTGLTDAVEIVGWHPDAAGTVLLGRWRGDDRSCVVKLAGREELAWMPAVSERSDDVVAEVLAVVDAGADGAWMVLEDLRVRGRSDDPVCARAVMRATARFQQVAADLDLPTYPIDAAFAEDFADRSAADPDCPGRAAVVGRRARDDDAWVRSLGQHVRGHGDVHFWNALAPTPAGPWRLVDPIPRTAHWAWDAAYAQMTSGVAGTPDLITLLEQERRRLGLAVCDPEDRERLRVVLLGWSAVLWWSIQVGRRDDRWWVNEIGRRIDELAELD